MDYTNYQKAALEGYYDCGQLKGSNIADAVPVLADTIKRFEDFDHDVPEGIIALYLRLHNVLYNEIL
jgi:hypothetical protein